MAESKKAKKERALKILAFLKQEYPDAKCSLNFTNPLELLIATILSAQCTDDRVNIETVKLFKKYKSPEDYVNVPHEELAQDVRKTGFYNNKAKNIQKCCQSLIDNFDSEVPKTLEELTSLAGVGRKTANVLLGNVFGVPGITVDTHMKRLAMRMGFTKETDQTKIEFDIMELIPNKDWTHFSHLMIYHGRAVCQARKPKCLECDMHLLCPSSEI